MNEDDIKIVELCSEVINLEKLLIDLGEKADFLAIKKFENIRDYLPPERHCDRDWIIAFYHGYISELYGLYAERMNGTKLYFYTDELFKNAKYYNKRNKKDWRD